MSSNHVHVFDSEVYCLRFQYGAGRYTGAVDLGCACGKKRTFTPRDPNIDTWAASLGVPQPPLDSQPPHLAWRDEDFYG